MKKVIIIDDTEDTVELGKAVLELNDIEAIGFNDARKALTELKKGLKPDLIITDMRMPEMSGSEFCAELRKDDKLKNLKVVYFTASSEKEDPKLKEGGVIGCIFKPFDNDKFIMEVKKFLNKL